MNISQRLFSLGEPYAAGFFEEPERDRFYRYALAQKRYWESVDLPEYDGGLIYPCGVMTMLDAAVRPGFAYTMGADLLKLRAKDEEAAALIGEELGLLTMMPPSHTVGGNGFTHSIPNYGRVVCEGLNGHRRRVMALPDGDFKDGLLAVLEGIETLRRRVVERLSSHPSGAEIAKALQKVPFQPADTLYEALICWNFVYYLDGCDDPGRLDADLIEFHRGEDMTELLRAFFVNVDKNNGWSSALGPDYNALTIQCLRAIHGLRRPSLELRVKPDMPEAVWRAAIDALMTGCGQPALYNEPLYQKTMAEFFPDIPKADLLRFNGGGCTETMLAGISNVGSCDAGVNLALVFSEYARRMLPEAEDFDTFYDGFIQAAHQVTIEVLWAISNFQKTRSLYRPQPVRTLLIDDCVDVGLDFNAGGARYYWSVVNVAGLINVIDSMLAIQSVVFERRLVGRREYFPLLDAEDPHLLGLHKNSPCFGVDDAKADEFAADLTGKVFDAFDRVTPFLGGRFLASSIQFATYADAGARIPATPDGRREGAPLCDSVGAVHGKDVLGPTALLNSVARLPLYRALGTPVLNLRLQKQFIRNSLQPLIDSFFEMGGMQAQISCASREEMLDAIEHPEAHEHLIVRIGGYSEYFNRLTDDLKRTVIERTEFA